jgi:hypothetical protein
MADSPAFAWTCAEIARAASLSELVSRGTVRLALKKAGLEPDSVSGPEMTAVLRKILPQELAARAVAGSREICAELAVRITGRSFAGEDNVVAAFRRLSAND